MKTIAVLQPGYLPWLGFFEQMYRCDLFVYYDDVQYDKHGWRNRNRVRSANGPLWLTVPVRHKGLNKPLIREIEIDSANPWARKQIASIEQCYAKAPFARDYLPELRELLSRPWRWLIDLDLTLIEQMCRWLGLERQTCLASELGIPGERSERLLEICRRFEADRYLSGNAAQTYLDVDLFARHGVTVAWQNYHHPVYPQIHGEFIPYLSTLDLLLNAGPESLDILAAGDRDTARSKDESTPSMTNPSRNDPSCRKPC